MSSFVLDASHSPGTDNDLSHIPYPSDPSGEPLDSKRVLNVSDCHLISLVATPTSPLAEVLRFITTLHAPNNGIASLSGIEAFTSLEVMNLSHNALHVVDASMLPRLRHLRVIDLSHNKIRLLEIDPSVSAGLRSARGASGSSSRLIDPSQCSMNVTSINLAHNQLHEVPDLRCLPALQIANFDYNRIDELSDLDVKLPLLALHTVHLRANRLPNASSVIPLTVLSQTLQHLHLYGNPFTTVDLDGVGKPSAPNTATGTPQPQSQPQQHQQPHAPAGSGDRRRSVRPPQPWWWRAFILWLDPLLKTLDMVSFTPSERQSAQQLFRERGELSKGLIEMLNLQSREALESYLRRQAERTAPPAEMLDIVQAMDDAEVSRATPGAEDDEEDYENDSPAVRPNSNGGGSVRRGQDGAGGTATVSPSVHHADPTTGLPSVPPPSGTPPQPSSTSTTTGKFQFSLPPSQHQQQTVVVPSSSRRESVNASSGAAGGAVAALPDVVRAIQHKLKTLSSVVETLWREDLVRRTFAAIVIQKHIRAALARMHLSDDIRESCQFTRSQLQYLLSPAHYAAMASSATVTATPPAGKGSATPTPVPIPINTVPPPPVTANESSSMNELLGSMKALQQCMTSMLGDLEDYRVMAERERRRAATTIQRHYRGYKSRELYRAMKLGYDEFVKSLGQDVQVLQRAGRGYLARKRLAKEKEDKAEVRALRVEVAGLRHDMTLMHSLLQQVLEQQAAAQAKVPFTGIIVHEPLQVAGQSRSEPASTSRLTSYSSTAAATGPVRSGKGEEEEEDSAGLLPSVTSPLDGDHNGERRRRQQHEDGKGEAENHHRTLEDVHPPECTPPPRHSERGSGGVSPSSAGGVVKKRVKKDSKSHLHAPAPQQTPTEEADAAAQRLVTKQPPRAK